MDSKKLNIIVLCMYSFPEGMAPTIRIISYGKGLVQNGANVKVVIYRPMIKGANFPEEGWISGVSYIYSHVRDPKKSKLYKLFVDRPKSLINAIRIIRRYHKASPVDCILFSFDDPKFILFFSIIFRLLGIRTGFIGDEFPEPIRRLKNKLPWTYIWTYKIAYKFISFRILMTEALREFYDSLVCPKPTYILCSIVDSERFDGIRRTLKSRPYICYMGNMMLAKDNVDNIIKAFALVANDFPEVDLYLYGTPNEQDEAAVRKVIKETGLENRVFVKGRINYALVPQTLASAEILVTSQPVTRRAEGGFPTKLAEYMMSHTPAIVTDVGEIHKWVKDKDTVYMVEPCNPEAYAATIKYILTNKEEAAKVAERAYNYAVTNFGSREVARRLKDFLNIK